MEYFVANVLWFLWRPRGIFAGDPPHVLKYLLVACSHGVTHNSCCREDDDSSGTAVYSARERQKETRLPRLYSEVRFLNLDTL